MKCFRWLVLFGMFLVNSCIAAVVVNDEIHYIGKVVFPIAGISHSNDNNCTWNVEGGVTLVLSFSRSTSLATFFVKHSLTSSMGQELCPDKSFSSNFSFPLNVNVENRSYSAISPDGERSIQGNYINDKVNGTYNFQSNGLFEGNESHWSGSFSTTLKEIPGEFIDVSQISGDVTTTIPLGTLLVKDSIPDASTIITSATASATLQEKFGSFVTLRSETIMTRLPLKRFAERELRTLVLTRGKIETRIKGRERDYKVVTPVASIELKPLNLTNKRASENTEDTEFSTEYVQNGDMGELSVSVTSGTVVVTDSENTTTVSAGMEYSHSTLTNQTSWVQPADGGTLYGGVENTLGWTMYPDAASYLLEYNFPNPKFSEENPGVPEFLEQSITITPDMYTIYESLVVVNMIMPEIPDSIVEARVYPMDEDGNIINQAVGSDRTTLTFQ